MPRRFPIIQFPNRPLLVAVAAGMLARASGGRTRGAAGAVSRLAMMYWAAQEIVSGANWFRRLLGLASGANAARRLARSLR